MNSRKVTDNSISDLRYMIVTYIKKKEYSYQRHKISLYSHEHQRAIKQRKRLKSILRKRKHHNQ
jgi:hypothetical protein